MMQVSFRNLYNIGLKPAVNKSVAANPKFNDTTVSQSPAFSQSSGSPWASSQALRFSGETKRAPNSRANDPYIVYTPDNTPCPLATWHTFATSKGMKYHYENAKVLEEYIAGNGERYQDIPWIKHKKPVGDESYTVFDTETTGVKAYDRIVQFATTQVGADHKINHDMGFVTLVNPGINNEGFAFRIKEGATEIHGITDEMVKGKPTMEELLPQLSADRLRKSGLHVAYNAKFDVPFYNKSVKKWNHSLLRRENGYIRPLDNALVIDPFVLMQRMHPFVSTRKRLGEHYEILMGRDLENKHNAQADTEATVEVLKYCLKYLQKHMIPESWAKFVAKNIPDKPSLSPEQKAAYIARAVQTNRKLLEEKMPVEPQKLLIIDVLRFQHGAPVYHEGTKLPKLDIVLNNFGWDSAKRWDNTDALDPQVADTVRKERDQENRELMAKKFREKLKTPQFEILRSHLQTVLADAKNKPKNPEGKEPPIGIQLYEHVEERFVPRVFQNTLPRRPKGWTVFKGDMLSSLKKFVNTKLRDKTVEANAKKAISKALPEIAEHAINAIQQIQQETDGRSYYTYAPIGNKPLIDPNIQRMLERAAAAAERKQTASNNETSR